MLTRLRVLLVIIGAVAQIVLGGLPFILNWENTIASRSNSSISSVIPSSYAFSIWNILFLGSLIFAIIHALPKYHQDSLFSKVGWLAALAFFGNALWEIYVPLYGFTVISLLIISVMILSPLLVIMDFLKKEQDSRWFFIPLVMLCGWVSVATFVNISVMALFLGFNPFMLTETTQAIIVILSAGLITIFFAYYFNEVFYNICVLWGFVGIYMANAEQSTSIAFLALALGIAGFLIAVIVRSKQFNWPTS